MNTLLKFKSAFDEINDDAAIKIDVQRGLLPTLALGLKFGVDVLF